EGAALLDSGAQFEPRDESGAAEAPILIGLRPEEAVPTLSRTDAELAVLDHPGHVYPCQRLPVFIKESAAESCTRLEVENEILRFVPSQQGRRGEILVRVVKEERPGILRINGGQCELRRRQLWP